jgi:hypothetical protein
MQGVMTRSFFPFALGLALFTAGCTGNPLGGAEPTPAAAPTAPTVNMSGRWRLVSIKGAACAMTFTSEGTEGSIAPEGGCPANFYTSRRWVFDQGSLIIQDHNRKTLVAMKQNPSGSFDGELSNRELVRLER